MGERSDPYHAMGKSETRKAGSYRMQLLQAKSHPAVTAGVRVIIYRMCAFTSLGELGKGTVKFVNGAACRLPQVRRRSRTSATPRRPDPAAALREALERCRDTL